ncbi:hypothetical protein SAMCFNEI73_Ch2693 [Sinorhizobium americanum]|uniref:Uncharacterized protein n=1 Tax=Sinorhizobium americanum TaxID=194963 RepID=A0A1L3LPF6_9HYPH|nr:hypothetical protein SAMCCGM7_Ch2567 [Sinorhizobium americanum CCGM7]APG91969.1 hypothetical protein SAMCFNEI73_Ch2693 [Sinorhizobium americanum]
MLAAIYLYDQALVTAGKISEIRTDRKLPDEFEAVETPVPQLRPED